jgi:hypothetical protein
MDATRFDALTRHLSSRRTVVSGLVGGGIATLLASLTGGEAGAAPKRCPRGKKKCGNRCIPKKQPCCTQSQKRCGTKCIPKSHCCTNANCGDLKLCAKGKCIVGQGTCTVGANICPNGGSSNQCDTATTANCSCYRTTTDKTRCGHWKFMKPVLDACINDQECAAAHPDVPGVFCARGGSGGSHGGCPSENFCQAPCPS